MGCVCVYFSLHNLCIILTLAISTVAFTPIMRVHNLLTALVFSSKCLIEVPQCVVIIIVIRSLPYNIKCIEVTVLKIEMK